MKYISLLVISVFILASCNSESQKSRTESSNIVDIKQENLSGTDCSVKSQLAQENLLEANINPNIELEFLGSVYSNSTASCLLQVKIIDKTQGSQSTVYSLFNTVSERTYKTFSSLEEMEDFISIK